MPEPPLPNITVRDLEALMDAFAYLLQNDSRTDNINWILGEPGIGNPPPEPFGYINQISEVVTWYTAQGQGQGGLAAGLDDWAIPVVITVGVEPHRYPAPIVAQPPDNSPFALANLGFQVNYLEAPGWRNSLQIAQNIKKVLRTNINVSGAATDTRIVESRFLLMEIDDRQYRAIRMTIQTQQRRIRGN